MHASQNSSTGGIAAALESLQIPPRIETAKQCLHDTTEELKKIARLLKNIENEEAEQATLAAAFFSFYPSAEEETRYRAKMAEEKRSIENKRLELETMTKASLVMKFEAEKSIRFLKSQFPHLTASQKLSIARLIALYQVAVESTGGTVAWEVPVEAKKADPEQLHDPHQALLSAAEKICNEKTFLQALRDKNYGLALRKVCAIQNLALFRLIKPCLSSNLVNETSASNGWTALDWLQHSRPEGTENQKVLQHELIALGAESGIKPTTSAVSAFRLA